MTPGVLPSKGRIVTFYSYKGGVGRTMSLANIACLLVRWGFSVLCVDWDLEAPGLHYYLKAEKGAKSTRGLIDLLLSNARRSDAWRDHLIRVTLLGTTQKFHLIAAGLQNPDYLSRVQQLNWPELYKNKRMGSYLEELRDQWKAEYDFVLIDSRTGITDIGGICTLQLPDLLILLFTANYQGLDGIARVAQDIMIEHANLPIDRPQLPMLPVITSFAGRTEVELGRSWLKNVEDKLEFIYAKWAHRDAPISEVINCGRVPYVSYWSFGEGLPVLEENERDPEMISYAFATLAAMITRNLSETDLLIRNRDSYVDGAQPRGSEDIAIYFARKDREVVVELKKHISPLLRQGVLREWIERELNLDTTAKMQDRAMKAGIILILVSPDLWATNFQSSDELLEILRRHSAGGSAVSPIIVRYAGWKDSPLRDLPVLPQDGQPIVRFENPDSAFAQIASSVKNLAEHTGKKKQKHLASQVRKKTIKELFFSYAHQDARLVEHLKVSLKLLKRQGLIGDWMSRDITAGEDWIGISDDAVERADIILLFVSSDFLASDYCYGREVKRALERQESGEARVIPIILRPTLWLNSPLGRLQALPRGGKPVTEWPSVDDAIMDVVLGLKDVLVDMV